MKFGDGFTGFGPNFIFNCECSEQPVLSHSVQNCFPIRCPCGCQFFNFWRHRYFGLGQQARSADFYILAFHERLRASTSLRLEIRSRELGHASTFALPSGCSEVDSTAAARAIRSFSVVPDAAANPDTAGEPRVRVPVLSKMTISKLRTRSSASLSLTRRPF